MLLGEHADEAVSGVDMNAVSMRVSSEMSRIVMNLDIQTLITFCSIVEVGKEEAFHTSMSQHQQTSIFYQDRGRFW